MSRSTDRILYRDLASGWRSYNSVRNSDLGKRYFCLPTARCRDTHPIHLIFTWYRQPSAASRRPLCEANQINNLLLVLILNVRSFRLAVILSTSDYVLYYIF